MAEIQFQMYAFISAYRVEKLWYITEPLHFHLVWTVIFHPPSCFSHLCHLSFVFSLKFVFHVHHLKRQKRVYFLFVKKGWRIKLLFRAVVQRDHHHQVCNLLGSCGNEKHSSWIIFSLNILGLTVFASREHDSVCCSFYSFSHRSNLFLNNPKIAVSCDSDPWLWWFWRHLWDWSGVTLWFTSGQAKRRASLWGWVR